MVDGVGGIKSDVNNTRSITLTKPFVAGIESSAILEIPPNIYFIVIDIR